MVNQREDLISEQTALRSAIGLAWEDKEVFLQDPEPELERSMRKFLA